VTVTAETSSITYTGNDATVAFSFPYRFLENAHLRVVRTVIATGVETELTLDSGGVNGFTATGAGDPAGGGITVVTAPTTLQRLTIDLGNIPATQEQAYVPNTTLPAQTVEKALDKLTMLVQNVIGGVGISRVLKLIIGDTDGSGRYDANGNEIVDLADGTAAQSAATVAQVSAASTSAAPFVADVADAQTRTVLAKLRDTVSIFDVMTTAQIADVQAGTGLEDIGPTIQALTDYLTTLPQGGLIYFPEGSYRIGASIVPKSNVHWRGAGPDLTIFLTNDGYTQPPVWGQGSLGSELTATADYGVGDDTFTMASTHGFAVGDIIRVIGQRNALSDDADDEWRLGFGTPGAGACYFGEFVQVKTQDGTTGFTTYSGLSFPDYNNDDASETDPDARAATTFQKMTPVQNVVIENIGVLVEGDTSAAFRFRYGYRCVVRNCKVNQQDFTGAAVYLHDSLDCLAENIDVEYGPDIDLVGDKANYNGFKTAGAQGCIIADCRIRNCSQGVDFTYLTDQVATLHCGMYRCVVTAAQTSGATSHGGSYAITFDGNKFLNVRQGISCRSRSSVIANNIATYSGGVGASVSNDTTHYGFGIYEGWARDCVMSGNTAKGGFYAGFGVFDGGSDDGECFGYTGLQCVGNTAAECRYGFVRSARAGNAKTEHAGTQIVGNTFRKCYSRFVYIEGVHPGTIIRGNTMDTLQNGATGIYIGADAHPHTVIENNWIKDCGAAVRVIDTAASTLVYGYTTNNTLLVRGNKVVGTNGTPFQVSASLVDWDLFSTQAVNRVGAVPLLDGITAPTNATGVAFTYIDTADGDYKIKFADGVTKTLATDT
jgi:hypothetical protein